MIKNFVYLNTKKKSMINDLEKNFFLYIVGKPGSGKSTIISEMLLNPELLNNKFDFIFLFSPSQIQDLQLSKDKNWFTDFSISKIFDIIEAINKLNKMNLEILFIFDDMISLFKKYKTDTDLTKFIFNRRHLLQNNGKISIMITSQNYIMLPSHLRSNITHLLIFSLNAKELITIIGDCSISLTLYEIKQLYKNIYDFLYINLINGKIYKNFLEEI